MIDGVVGFLFVVIYAVGGVTGYILTAPIRQRDEARSALVDLSLKKEEWLSLEAGGRYYRDLLAERGMTYAVSGFDNMSSPHPSLPSSNPVANAFRWIVGEALNEGEMEVWGTPENGSAAERILSADSSTKAFTKSREGEDFFLSQNGVFYRDLQIKRSTIKSYVEHMRKHDAELERRAKRKKD